MQNEYVVAHVENFVEAHPSLTAIEIEFLAQCLEVALARGVSMSIEEAHRVLIDIIGLQADDTLH